MRKPFSDPLKIEKMVRVIDVLSEQQTLEVFHLPWNGSPWKIYPGWIKYVSTEARNKRKVYLYWDQKFENRFMDDLHRRLTKNKRYFFKLENIFLDSYRNFEEFSDRLFKLGSGYFSSLDDKKILRIFQEYERYSRQLMVGYYIPYYMCALSLDILSRELKRNGIKKSEELLKKISTLGISSMMERERRDFLRSLIAIQRLRRQQKTWKDPKIQAIISRHYYRLGPCVFTHGSNRSYSLEDFCQKFKKQTRLNSQKELEKIRKKKAAETRQVKNILSELEPYPGIRQVALWLRKMMGYRNSEAELYHAYFEHLQSFFDELEKRLDLRRDDLWYLSKEEIRQGIAEKRSPDSIVKERKKRGFTIKQSGQKIVVMTGVQPEDVHKEKIKFASKSIKGSPAFKGKTAGRARIISDPFHEGKHFKKDEILVTAMTTPEFVPLMKRARAIITDEGGLLCHAAIVARELKKPCIIGTKVATQFLKDGDLVEVDAERGIIKILNK